MYGIILVRTRTSIDRWLLVLVSFERKCLHDYRPYVRIICPVVSSIDRVHTYFKLLLLSKSLRPELRRNSHSFRCYYYCQLRNVISCLDVSIFHLVSFLLFTCYTCMGSLPLMMVWIYHDFVFSRPPTLTWVIYGSNHHPWMKYLTPASEAHFSILPFLFFKRMTATCLPFFLIGFKGAYHVSICKSFTHIILRNHTYSIFFIFFSWKAILAQWKRFKNMSVNRWNNCHQQKESLIKLCFVFSILG